MLHIGSRKGAAVKAREVWQNICGDRAAKGNSKHRHLTEMCAFFYNTSNNNANTVVFVRSETAVGVLAGTTASATKQQKRSLQLNFATHAFFANKI